MDEFIRMGSPDIGEEEANSVKEQILSGWISQGPKTKEFEEVVSNYVDSQYSVAMSNGTVTLHSILRSIGISKGDYVVVPSLTYISSVNVIYECQAIPIYCDVDPSTLLIDYEQLEVICKKFKPKLVMSVDLKGMPCDYDLINQICKENNCLHISDSAESLGGMYKNKRVGTQALIHSFSLFANKTITTGEGGIITTNSDDHYEKLKLLRNQGQSNIRYQHIELGYNYRFTDVKATIGLEQMKKLNNILERRLSIVSKIKNLLNKKINFQHIPDYVTLHPYYNLTPLFESKSQRDFVQQKLNENKIETRISFPPCHLQPYHKNLEKFTFNNLPNTIKSYECMLDIPCHQNLSDSDIDNGRVRIPVFE